MNNSQNHQAIDRYQILDLLSTGDSWKLYKAYDPKFQRDIAFLMVQPRDDQQRQQLLKEARKSMRMHHSGVIQTYGFGQAEGYFYLVLEFLPGMSLMGLMQNLQQAHQRILLPEAIQLVGQVARALENIHQRGVQHYGLNPQLIRLRDERGEGLPYQPVLADPGLSLRIGNPAGEGAVTYLSPEEVLDKKADSRSDVFALGVLLYELIFYQPPFDASTKEVLATAYRQGQQPALQTNQTKLPKGSEQFIKKALALDPAERYESAEAFGKALAEAFPGMIGLDLGMEASSPLLAAFRSSLNVPQKPTTTPDNPPGSGGGPQVPAEPLRIFLQILEADHTIRRIPLTPGKLTIGRDQDNQLCLQDPRASRHHARLEFDGSNLSVLDLNSKNGTYLGNTRLEPNTPVKWEPGVAVRIGGTWLRLETGEQTYGETQAEAEVTGSQPTVARTAPAPETALFEGSPKTEKIMLSVEPARLSVIPGSKVVALATLWNHGTTEEEFQLSVQGVPVDWVTGFPRTVRIAPGQRQELRLEFLPPRRSSSKAGRHSFTLRVASRSAPNQVTEAGGVLTLGAFSEVQSQVLQGQVQTGDVAQVRVRNQGNAPETVTVSWNGEGVTFDPPQVKLNVPPGQSAMAEAVARASQPHWIGAEQNFPFTTYVHTASGQAETHAGTLRSTGLLPAWAPLAALLACLALLGGAVLLAFILNLAGGSNVQTRQQTATAVAFNSTVQAVGTATAQWMSSDDDRDGLSNEQELKVGTLSNVFDTDGDGLGDGEEVVRGLNPLQADTDGDGWIDSQEIARGTDPKNKDTDGDGLIDSQDPDPGHASTATPSSTPTPTLTPVPGQPTPTITLTRTPSSTPSPTPTITPSATVTFTPKPSIPPANQPPVIIVNGAGQINEDEEKPFLSNWITISDPDAGDKPIQVSLEAGAGNGILTVVNHEGLSGEAWSGQSLTFTGPQGKIRDAMKIVNFKPADKFPGKSSTIVNIVIHVNDLGNTGSGNAGTDEKSFPVTVNGVNDAPVMNVDATIELQMTSEGVPIKEILRYLPIDDQDQGALRGIALTEIQPTAGNWEYTLDQSTWISVTKTTQGDPSEAKALLLAADEQANTRIRFRWLNGQNQTDPVEITFHAWDQTSEKKNGESSNTNPNGGINSFSSGAATVKFTFPVVQNENLQQHITSKWMDVLVVPEFLATFVMAALNHLFGGRIGR